MKHFISEKRKIRASIKWSMIGMLYLVIDGIVAKSKAQA